MGPKSLERVKMTIDDLKQEGIYFHSTGEEFCYTVICLASGFHQLGIPIYGNIDYENPLVSDLKIPKLQSDTTPAMMLIDVREGTFTPNMPFRIDGAHQHTHVVAVCDSIESLNYQSVFPLYRGHCNRLIGNPYTYKPLGFGVSDRLATFSESFDFEAQRDEVVLRNFRSSANQHLRLSMELSLLPLLQDKIGIDRRLTKPTGRFDNEFLERLQVIDVSLLWGQLFGRFHRFFPRSIAYGRSQIRIFSE